MMRGVSFVSFATFADITRRAGAIGRPKPRTAGGKSA